MARNQRKIANFTDDMALVLSMQALLKALYGGDKEDLKLALDGLAFHIKRRGIDWFEEPPATEI